MKGLKPYKTHCIICGTAITPPKQRRYCSQNCYSKRYVEKYKSDKSFRDYRIKEASDRQKFTRREVLKSLERNCVICQCRFIPTRQNVKYCTRKCYKKAKTNRKTEAMFIRRKTDPAFRLRSIVSDGVRKSLKSRGLRKPHSCFKYIPYTPVQLKAHVESFFNNKNGFTWENHGEVWQLDHTIPQEYFPYTTMDSKMFRDCWALSNLIPVPTWFNSWKSDRFAGTIDDDGNIKIL